MAAPSEPSTDGRLGIKPLDINYIPCKTFPDLHAEPDHSGLSRSTNKADFSVHPIKGDGKLLEQRQACPWQ